MLKKLKINMFKINVRTDGRTDPNYREASLLNNCINLFRKSKPSESAPKYYWDDTNPEEEEKK